MKEINELKQLSFLISMLALCSHLLVYRCQLNFLISDKGDTQTTTTRTTASGSGIFAIVQGDSDGRSSHRMSLLLFRGC